MIYYGYRSIGQSSWQILTKMNQPFKGNKLHKWLKRYLVIYMKLQFMVENLRQITKAVKSLKAVKGSNQRDIKA